jgi:hypothetical protein
LHPCHIMDKRGATMRAGTTASCDSASMVL